MAAGAKTLVDKVWESHLVRAAEGEPDLLFIDLHLVHEVTSPQAFDGLRMAGRGVRRPDLTVATADHNVPTTDVDKPIADPISRKQLEVLSANCAEYGIVCYPMGNPNQGIVHVIGPELGLSQPGMTIVCGDSHTSTHGAMGALAFGIGTSEVEHVLATQTLPQVRPATMAVTVDGDLPAGVSAKDIVLAALKVGVSHFVGCDQPGPGTPLDAHVADRHPALHGERPDGGAPVLDHVGHAAPGPDGADDGQCDVLGRDARGEVALDGDCHRPGPHLGQRLGGQHVLHLARADAEGERAEGAVGRGVRVAADDRHAGLGDAQLGTDHVHDALPV